MTPIGGSGGKKRRVTPSNSGARCPAKNVRVEVKKTSEKSVESPLDDKVVSSSCEVDCSSAVSLSVSSKTLLSRRSLDYFVHTTQQLEVTTSSTDGDFVDLTAEDESASEAAALSTTVADGTDMMPPTFYDEEATKVSEPVAAECSTKTVTHLTCVPAEESAEMAKVNDKTKKDSCSNDLDVEVQCIQQKEAQDLASIITDGSTCTLDTGNASSTCVTVPCIEQNVQEVDSSAVSLLDGQKTMNDDPAIQDAIDSESPLDKSGSDAADDAIEMAESPASDNRDVELNEATVISTSVGEENMMVSSGGEKSEVSTSSVNVNDEQKTTAIDSKSKVRKFICTTLYIGTENL